ncbi:hypothetical protein WMY93_020254 [Mugilogobius chulae]|uniref:Uncharacterized protein n=1 Tax=Mugilogobius chulae TaxID=88201 RepID=A0AAW0NGT1_9GOBI
MEYHKLNFALSETTLLHISFIKPNLNQHQPASSGPQPSDVMKTDGLTGTLIALPSRGTRSDFLPLKRQHTTDIKLPPLHCDLRLEQLSLTGVKEQGLIIMQQTDKTKIKMLISREQNKLDS